MLPQRRYSFALVLSLVALFLAPYSAEADEQNSNCKVVLNAPSNGISTISKLGDQLSYVATINRLSVDDLKIALASTPEYFLDKCGRAYFAETTMVAQELPLPQALDSLPNPISTGNGIGARPYTDPTIIFKLHSNPTSKRILYLNFKGRQVTGTSWNASYNNDNPWFANGFSQDSDFNNFSSSEMEIIQSVWQRVAEDYSPFDIDVTTQEPNPDAINRTDSADNTFGTEVVISGDSVIFNSCKCSGLAYLGAFDLSGKNHFFNQPAWVFTRGVGDNPKFIAEAITHEAGHTFGLSHDGTDSSSYFVGAEGWAPIMGVGFYQPVTQWSKGEYKSANNLEDEYSIMAKHGLNLRADEDGNSFESSRVIKVNEKIGGVIASPNDIDYFTFIVPTTGDYTIRALPATFSANLDINLKIVDNTNLSSVIQVNPPLRIVNNDAADGLSATYTGKFIAQKRYFIMVSGSKVNFPEGSSNYGSVGTYQVQLDSGSIQKISILPNLDATKNNPILNTSSSPDISVQLVTPALTDGLQGLILPSGIQDRMSLALKRLKLRLGRDFE